MTGRTLSANFPTLSAVQATCTNCGAFYDAYLTKFSAAGSALTYSTFLGAGGDDWGMAVALDSSANAYLSGYTQSAAFPLKGALQASIGGVQDSFVAKIGVAPVPLALSPASATLAPKASQTFTASGGSGSGYT